MSGIARLRAVVRCKSGLGEAVAAKSGSAVLVPAVLCLAGGGRVRLARSVVFGTGIERHGQAVQRVAGLVKCIWECSVMCGKSGSCGVL